ncbi:MAG TPA: amino acid adenylation domain-containing protein [Halomicronema sp.]
MDNFIKDLVELSSTKRALFEVLLKEKGLTLSKIEKVRREPGGQYPLSFAQQRVWFLEQLDPGNAVYNETTTVRLSGPVDVSVLELSLNEIIRRHEILRTTFVSNEGEPKQVISDLEKLSLSVEDLRLVAAESKEAEVWKQSAKLAQKPFDLSKWPLMKARLFQLEENDFVLLIIWHHIITDGWSSQIFIRELSVIYEAFLTGNSSPLPPLVIQYADFAHWQKEWLQGEILETQLAYWKKQLGGKLPVLDLPTDYPRPAIQSFRGARESLMLAKPFSDALNSFCRQEGATLFMTILAAFQTLLYRHTGQEDILVGSPIAGRNRSEIENVIGFFINTLVFRTNLEGNPTFQELLQRVRRTALEAYNHQEMPFEKLVEAVQPERDLSRTPIFQVFFNLLNFDQNSIEVGDLNITPLPRPELESKFDITLYVREKIQGTQIEFVYNADLFTAGRIKEMLAQLQILLEQIIENPQLTLSSYFLVTPNARSILPDPSAVLLQPYYKPITEIIAEKVELNPQTSSICKGSDTWTYLQLSEAATNIARTLIAQGIKSGDTVAVTGPRSFGLIASILGILLSGGVLLTLARNLPESRKKVMLQEAKTKSAIYVGIPRAEISLFDSLNVIIVDENTATTGELPLEYLTENLPQKIDNLETIKLPEISPDDPAYIFFTSGTTGTPKGVLGCHKGLSHFLAWQRQTFKIDSTDRSGQLTGLSFDVVLRDIFLPLTSGATLCLPTVEDDLTPATILPWLEREKISLLHTVPTLAESWLINVPASVTLKNLRLVFFAGEPLKEKLLNKWRKAFPESGEIINIYGPTETTLAKCFYPVPKPALPGVQPVGSTLPETQALVLNKNNVICGIGEPGEIAIRTFFRSYGYINSPDENKRFVKNPFRDDEQDLIYYTGDRGRYRPDGLLEILGRLDHQVKIRGVRIELAEIEAILGQHPDVERCVAMARENSEGEKNLVAYIVLKSGTKSIHHIREFLKEKLPAYMIPSALVLLDKIPMTPNGKIDRKALPEPEFERNESPDSFVAPRNQIEAQLVEIWQSVLGVKNVGVTDNFFDLGGHSLLGLRLFAQIEKTMGKTLPLPALFQAPTIEKITNLLNQKDLPASFGMLIELQPEGKKRPLFCIHAVGGNVFSYQIMTKYMGKNRPIYGLQSKGLYGKVTPNTRVEDMAADCIQEMKSVQPEGPYLLAGHSFGGVLAFEIAQQLVKAGEKVALLAVLDTFSPLLFKQSRPPFSYQLSIHKLNLSRLEKTEQIKYITDRVKWKVQALINKLNKKLFTKNLDAVVDEVPEYLQLIESLNHQAARQYKPQVYPGKITLLRAIERPTTKYYDPLLGWDKLAAGGVDIAEVPGHHKTMILEPRVRFLAKKLEECIERALKTQKISD